MDVLAELSQQEVHDMFRRHWNSKVALQNGTIVTLERKKKLVEGAKCAKIPPFIVYDKREILSIYNQHLVEQGNVRLPITRKVLDKDNATAQELFSEMVYQHHQGTLDHNEFFTPEEQSRNLREAIHNGTLGRNTFSYRHADVLCRLSINGTQVLPVMPEDVPKTITPTVIGDMSHSSGFNVPPEDVAVNGMYDHHCASYYTCVHSQLL